MIAMRMSSRCYMFMNEKIIKERNLSTTITTNSNNDLLKMIEKQINHLACALPQMKPDLLYLMSNFHLKQNMLSPSKMRMN